MRSDTPGGALPGETAVFLGGVLASQHRLALWLIILVGWSSYRDVEQLLAERGIEMDHVTIYRWVQRFTPLLIDAVRPCRHAPGDR